MDKAPKDVEPAIALKHTFSMTLNPARQARLGKNFIVHSIICPIRKSDFREELYFQTRATGQSKIKDLRPLQGRTLLFVNINCVWKIKLYSGEIKSWLQN
jgi:hypothetical protein